MNSNLQFDFIVDKEQKTITIRREFAAEQQLVWNAYTKSELLDQWFAPKPWQTQTKTMDFTEGGYWLYIMKGPEGKYHWGRMDYEKINPIDSFTSYDGFCDEDGNIDTKIPRTKWNTTFKAINKNTLVETVVIHDSVEDIETVMKMGMKEGFTMVLENLDGLLEQLKK